MGEAGVFLIDAFVQPFAAVLLFRFHAVWLRAPMRNPLGEFIMAITDFLVLRVRRYVPAIAGLDTATLLLAWLAELLYLGSLFALQGNAAQGFPLAALMLLALVKLLKISIYLLMAGVIAQAVLSWVNPRTAVAPMLNAVTYPFLQPLRRAIPLFGGVDLSPMLLLVICQLLVITLIGALEHMVFALF